MLRVAHDGGAVHVGRHLPAEALVEEVVLRGGGEIFAAAHDMGDAHEVVVDDVGKVVGRQTVALQEYLIVERLILHRDVAKACIVEGRGAVLRDTLANDVGLAAATRALASSSGRPRQGSSARSNSPLSSSLSAFSQKQ